MYKKRNDSCKVCHFLYKDMIHDSLSNAGITG
jgi:hypothetical protein